MQNKKAENLIKKYISGNCSEKEIALLESWYMQYQHTPLPKISELDKKKQLEDIWNSMPVSTQKVASPFYWTKIAAAAILFLVIGVGIYLSLNNNKTINGSGLAKKVEIKPGGNRALLTLANGTTVLLDDARIGELSNESGIKVSKTDDGQLQFDLNEAITDQKGESLFNTIETPKGGQYRIHLPDGTNAWLNAESSIKIPHSFSGKERLISITGEVYFEVVENKAKPFIVETNGVKIKVLGTHFNIMAYENEKEVKTTLMKGSVKLTYNNLEVLLKPGEQGSLDASKGKFEVAQVDTDDVLAWKNGFFQFNGTDLYTLMRKLSRWYDMEVVYEKGVKNEVFYGKIERSADFSKVLKILELGDVNFRIDKKKLIIIP